MISFGLGWDFTELPDYRQQGLNVLGKSGGTHQYTSMLFTLPEHRISVAVIATGPGAPAYDIALKLLDAVAADKNLLKPAPATVRTPRPAQPLPADLLSYEGYYAGDSGAMFKLSLAADSGALTLRSTDDPAAPPSLSAVYHDGLFYDSGDAKYYLTTVDQKHYLVKSSSMDVIMVEKIIPLAAPVQLSPKVTQPLWLRRNVQPYEGSLMVGQHMETLRQIELLPGYVDFGGLKRIVSPTAAGVSLASMRDASEVEFFEKDGRYWAWLSGFEYMPGDLAQPLAGVTDTVLLGRDGYNEWRKLVAAGIIETVRPQSGRVILFSPDGAVLSDSVWGGKAVYAPAGSFLEFAGVSGDRFTVKITPAE